MSKFKQKADEIIKSIKNGESIDSLKSRLASTEDDWHRFSSKAYNECITVGNRERKSSEVKSNVSGTKNKQIESILTLNAAIADYALLLPIFSTITDFNQKSTKNRTTLF